MKHDKQRLLIEYLISSPDVYAICDGVIDPRFFDPELRPAVAFMKNYYHEYKSIPDAAIINAETGIKLAEQSITRDKIEYCVNELERFSRQRAIVIALGECADLMQKEDYGTIESKLKAAVNLSVTKDIGISLFDEPMDILQRIAQSERPISTGYEDMDKKLFGGLSRKQLFVVSGPSGGGKSLLMGNLALNYAESGLRVLMVTMEMSQEMVYLRFASMVSGISQNGWFMHMDEMASRMQNYQAIYGNGEAGQLFIKHMPMGSRPSQIGAVIKEYELIHGAPPDVCVVDYIDIMGSDIKVPPENIHLKDKYVTEGLRELMITHNMIGISGSQITKGAQGEVDIDQSQIAGGQTKLNTVDVFANIMLTEEMKAAGVVGLKFLKTRSSDGKDKVAFMEFDPISLRFRNFREALSDAKLQTFSTLVKKQTASKNSPQQRVITATADPLAPESSGGDESRKRHASWLSQMVDHSEDST